MTDLREPPIEAHIQLTAGLQGWTTEQLMSLLQGVLSSSEVNLPDFGGLTVGPVHENTEPATAGLSFSVVVNDEKELIQSLISIESSLTAANIVLVEPPRLLSSRVIEPPYLEAQGLEFDQESQTIIIDTSRLAPGEVEIGFIGREDGRMTALIATNAPGHRRIEQAVAFKRLVLRTED